MRLCSWWKLFGAAAIGYYGCLFYETRRFDCGFSALSLMAREKPLVGWHSFVSCDDPGLQHPRRTGHSLNHRCYGITVFDPASPREAADVAFYALNYSFEHKKPVTSGLPIVSAMPVSLCLSIPPAQEK
jgi:hypothetical protein